MRNFVTRKSIIHKLETFGFTRMSAECFIADMERDGCDLEQINKMITEHGLPHINKLWQKSLMNK